MRSAKWDEEGTLLGQVMNINVLAEFLANTFGTSQVLVEKTIVFLQADLCQQKIL
jgi:hypothetical protein